MALPAWRGVTVALTRVGRVPLWLRLAIVGAVLLLLPLYGDDYLTAVSASVAMYAILGLGLSMVVGYAGLLDLGYAAFFAIGAYTAAVLMTDFGVSFWLTLPAAVAMAGIAGAIIGYPTLRLRSDYLAIVTLGFGEIVRISFSNWDYVGGPDGIWNVPAPSLFGWSLYSETALFIVVIALLGVSTMLYRNLCGSRVGRGWLFVREDEFAAEAAGVPTLRLKLMAYVIGGMWAGLAGAYFATRIGLVSPQSFTYQVSFNVLYVVIIGGMGSLPGILLGSLVVVGLPELLRGVDQYRLLAFAVALIIMMLLRPQGLWPRARGREELPAPQAPTQRPLPVVSRMPGGALLAVENLTRRFGGVIAVDNVSFAIRQGEIVSIIGPNGAGKTSVFNCITGVLPSLSGRIVHNGVRINGLRPHAIVRHGIARTFQGIRLFKQLPTFENVLGGMYPLHRTTVFQSLLHTPFERVEERRMLAEAAFWLDFVGLRRRALQMSSELPYADQRRLEIARALASQPDILLLDEPAAGMNPTEKAELMEMLRRIQKRGITILLIDHDMSLVMRISERILVMDQGQLIAEGAPLEVQSNPRVIDAYLGQGNDDDSQSVRASAAGAC